MLRIKTKIERDGFIELVRSIKINVFWNLENQILFRIPNLLFLCFRKPRFVNIELTNICNLRCKMCLRGAGRKEGFMDYLLFKKIVDECADIGGVSLNFHWSGESTLHPSFIRCMQYVLSKKKYFYKLALTTNGTVFNKETAKVCLGLDSVTFSVDGVGKVTENIRVRSNYETIKRNMLSFITMRGSKLEPIISTNTTITSQTDKELKDMGLKWGKLLNVNFSGCLGDNFELLEADRAKKFNLKWYKNYSGPRCYMPFSHILISWNGSLHFCCHNLKGRYPVGNFKDGLSKVWRGYKIKRIRKAIIKNRSLPLTICYSCKKYKWLGGDKRF